MQLKVGNKTFKAAFSRSKFSNEEEYIDHCNKMEELRDINVPNNGSLEQYNNFLKHYVIKDYDKLTDDFKEYCKEEEIIKDCNIDLEYKGIIKRNLSRYYPEKDFKEYCLEFKNMLDLENYVKSKYNKEYSNFYKQVFRYIKNGDAKKNYEYRFIYIPDLANSILKKNLSESEIHNILSGYGQVKNCFGSIEEYLYHLKDCHDFKNELEKRGITCTNDTVRHWKDAGKPSVDDWLKNKESLNFNFSEDEIDLMIKNGTEISNYSGPGVYIRYIGDIPVDVCETSCVSKEIENFYFIYNNILSWIKGMDYDDIENFHRESYYNIKKYICYNQYKGDIKNILISNSDNRNEREAIEFLVAKKINARYFCSIKLNHIPFYDYKEALKNIYDSATFISHNTQRPSGNVINSDLKNNIQMSTLLGGFGTSESTLCFDEDMSDFCKPEIKGRGFVKTGNDIYEYQSFWIPDPDYIKKDHFFESEKLISSSATIASSNSSSVSENNSEDETNSSEEKTSEDSNKESEDLDKFFMVEENKDKDNDSEEFQNNITVSISTNKEESFNKEETKDSSNSSDDEDDEFNEEALRRRRERIAKRRQKMKELQEKETLESKNKDNSDSFTEDSNLFKSDTEKSSEDKIQDLFENNSNNDSSKIEELFNSVENRDLENRSFRDLETSDEEEKEEINKEEADKEDVSDLFESVTSETEVNHSEKKLNIKIQKKRNIKINMKKNNFSFDDYEEDEKPSNMFDIVE